MGRDQSLKSASSKEFAKTKTSFGGLAYYVTVSLYKDYWAESLKTTWNKQEEQPERFFNAPINLPDNALKELTAEYKKEIFNPDGSTKAHEWHRPSHAANELWDLLIYANAALDIIAYSICIEDFEKDSIDWAFFWEYLEKEQKFYSF